MRAATPNNVFAMVRPQEPYMVSETRVSQPMKARPPTLKITPKKNSNVSHSAAALLTGS